VVTQQQQQQQQLKSPAATGRHDEGN